MTPEDHNSKFSMLRSGMVHQIQTTNTRFLDSILGGGENGGLFRECLLTCTVATSRQIDDAAISRVVTMAEDETDSSLDYYTFKDGQVGIEAANDS